MGMWQEVFYLMGKYFSGGPSLFIALQAKLYEMFDNKLVTPTMLQNVLGGLQKTAQSGFIGKSNLSDKSSCGVWGENGSCRRCDSEPGDACHLKDICVAMREEFLDAADTLSRARREESAWLGKHMDDMRQAEGKSLLELIGRHPGHVGDLVIFWEVPDGWTVLTRDRTFRILQKAHRSGIKVHILRLPRTEGGGSCRVRLKKGGGVRGRPRQLQL
jgi:hypothetical protein